MYFLSTLTCRYFGHFLLVKKHCPKIEVWNCFDFQTIPIWNWQKQKNINLSHYFFLQSLEKFAGKFHIFIFNLFCVKWFFWDIWCQERKSGYFRSLQLQFHLYSNAKDRQILWMKKMDKILTYESRKMSMARIRSSITWIIMPRQNSNIFTFQLIFKSKFYIREERFRDGFLREKCILLGIAWMSAGGGRAQIIFFDTVH